MKLPASDAVRSENADHLSSTLHLPPGDWKTVLECLSAHFANVGRETWLQRMQDGRVLDAQRRALRPDHPYRHGMRVHYFREVPDEQPVPFEEQVLHVDADLVVADKPHFLAVMPAGPYLEHTLQRRLIRRLGNPDLVPLHRIDRATAGLVLLSANPATRARYQALFREQRIEKHYQALAAPLPQCVFPMQRRSRLQRGEPFFRMQEVAGEPNTDTRIDVLQRGPLWWRYRLSPITGKQHQLRVHMAALGAPLRNDDFYPELLPDAGHDFARPLQLLAHSLAFTDPCSGEPRRFQSRLSLLED